MVNRDDQEEGDNKVVYSRDQKTGKLEDIELGNNCVGNSRNQDNRRPIIKDVVDLDSDARVTDAVDPIDQALADVLVHSFGPL